MDMIHVFIKILQLHCYAVPELPPSRNPLHNCTSSTLLNYLQPMTVICRIFSCLNVDLLLAHSRRNRFAFFQIIDFNYIKR